MVQLKVLNGNRAGSDCVTRRFPCRVGRAPYSDLVLTGDGVWDSHFEIRLDREEGFVLHIHPQAMAALNGKTVQQASLHNGDVIEAGTVRIQFWLSPTRQPGLWLREWLTWAVLVLLCGLQMVLIYRFLP